MFLAGDSGVGKSSLIVRFVVRINSLPATGSDNFRCLIQWCREGLGLLCNGKPIVPTLFKFKYVSYNYY